MNLYSEANKYFEEILKEENAKLNESLKKKKLKESIGSRKKLRETAIEDPYYLALDTTNPYYKVLLGILKNNKKIANSVWEEYIKDYLPDEGTDSPEEFKQNLLDSFFYDIIEEMVEEGDDDLARKVIDILGWKKHFSGYEYGLYDDTIPSVWYSVYELDKDGNELDEVDSFDTPEEAIAFAKKQSFPTHVVFVPEADPDDDPEYRRYLRDHYDYEPFEVVWESGVDESFNRKRNLMREAANSISDIKHLNLRDYGKGYRPPYAFDGAVYFDVKDNSLGKGINQLQAWEVDIAYNERRRRWFVDSDVAQGSGKTVKECVINTFKDFVNQSNTGNLGNANETSLGNAIDDRFVNYDAAPGESFPLYLIDMYHNN